MTRHFLQPKARKKEMEEDTSDLCHKGIGLQLGKMDNGVVAFQSHDFYFVKMFKAHPS